MNRRFLSLIVGSIALASLPFSHAFSQTEPPASEPTSAASAPAPAASSAEPATTAAAPVKTSHRRARRKRSAGATAKNISPANLESRHQVCLAFIKRHGLDCDPWNQPTCGWDVGYARPLECVAP